MSAITMKSRVYISTNFTYTRFLRYLLWILFFFFCVGDNQSAVKGEGALGCLKITPSLSASTSTFYHSINLNTGQISGSLPSDNVIFVSVSPNQANVVYLIRQNAKSGSLFIKPLKPSTKRELGHFILTINAVNLQSNVESGVNFAVIWSTDSTYAALHWRNDSSSLQSNTIVQDTFVLIYPSGASIQRTFTVASDSKLRLEGFADDRLVVSIEDAAHKVALTILSAEDLETVVENISLAQDSCYLNDAIERECMYWSPDEHWIVFALPNDNQPSTIVLYNLSKGIQQTFSQRPNSTIHNILWSPNNKTIAVVSAHSTDSHYSLNGNPLHDSSVNFYSTDGTQDLASLSAVVIETYGESLGQAFFNGDVQWLNNGETFFFSQLIDEGNSDTTPLFHWFVYELPTKQTISLVSKTTVTSFSTAGYREFHGKYLIITGIMGEGDQISTGVIDTLTGKQTVTIPDWQTWWWLASDFIIVHDVDSQVINWYQADGLRQGRLEVSDIDLSSTVDGKWLFFKKKQQDNKSLAVYRFNFLTAQTQLLYELPDPVEDNTVQYTRILPAPDNRSIVFLVGRINKTEFIFLDVDTKSATSTEVMPALHTESILHDSWLGSDKLLWAWSGDGNMLVIGHPFNNNTRFDIFSRDGNLLKQVNDSESIETIESISWTACQ